MDPPAPSVEEQDNHRPWVNMTSRESHRKLISDNHPQADHHPRQAGAAARIRPRRSAVKICRFAAARPATGNDDVGTSGSSSGAERKPRRKTKLIGGGGLRLNILRRLRLRRAAAWLFNRPRNMAKLLAKLRDGYVNLMMSASSSRGMEGVATLAPMSYRLSQAESDRPFGTRSVKEYDPSILLALHSTNSHRSSLD